MGGNGSPATDVDEQSNQPNRMPISILPVAISMPSLKITPSCCHRDLTALIVATENLRWLVVVVK